MSPFYSAGFECAPEDKSPAQDPVCSQSLTDSF